MFRKKDMIMTVLFWVGVFSVYYTTTHILGLAKPIDWKKYSFTAAKITPLQQRVERFARLVQDANEKSPKTGPPRDLVINLQEASREYLLAEYGEPRKEDGGGYKVEVELEMPEGWRHEKRPDDPHR